MASGCGDNGWGSGVLFCRLEMFVAHSEGKSAVPSKCALFKITLEMSLQLLKLYRELPSFPEIFLALDSNLAR